MDEDYPDASEVFLLSPDLNSVVLGVFLYRCGDLRRARLHLRKLSGF
jgi:hypothetical protein